LRDAERTNLILEDQLRQRDADLAYLRGRTGEARRERNIDESDNDANNDYDDSNKYNKYNNYNNNTEGRKCVACGRHQAQNAQLTHELTALKLECDNLQQKLDKMKNLIQIYRQEKRQMEEYIEKEKRTAKSLVAYPTFLFYLLSLSSFLSPLIAATCLNFEVSFEWLTQLMQYAEDSFFEKRPQRTMNKKKN
jgi:hypothetical protein